MDTRAHVFNVCLCTINCLGISCLLIYLFIHSSRSESDGKEGYHDWTRLQQIFFMWDNVCQPSQPSVSTEESLKNPVCTLPSGQTQFSCCYPSHDYSSTTTTTTTATLVSNKQRKNKSWKTRQWGYQFWQCLLSAHSHGGRFVRLCKPARWQLKHSSYLTVNFLKHCVESIHRSSLNPFFSGQCDEATRMIAWARNVNHVGNAVCLLAMLYWMWQRTSTWTRWHVVSHTRSAEKQKEHSCDRFLFAYH